MLLNNSFDFDITNNKLTITNDYGYSYAEIIFNEITKLDLRSTLSYYGTLKLYTKDGNKYDYNLEGYYPFVNPKGKVAVYPYNRAKIDYIKVIFNNNITIILNENNNWCSLVSENEISQVNEVIMYKKDDVILSNNDFLIYLVVIKEPPRNTIHFIVNDGVYKKINFYIRGREIIDEYTDIVPIYHNKCILYHNSSENSRLDKTDYLIKKYEYDIVFKDSVSVISPVILISTLSVLIDINYVYLSTFKRYYYIDDIVNISTGLWEISLTCDVLMSFKNDILNLDVYASRNEFNYDEFIPDEKIPSTCKVNYSKFQISSPTFIPPTDYIDVAYIIVLGGKYDAPGTPFQTPDFTTDMNKVLVTNGYTIGLIIQSLMGMTSQGSIFGSSIGDSIQGIYMSPFSGLNVKFKTVDVPYTINDNNEREYKVSFLGNTLTVKGDANYTRLYEIFGTKYGSKYDENFFLSTKLFPNNFLQYKPYSVAQLFLPYYGLLDVEPEFINLGIIIHYCFCIANNTCSIEIRGGDSKLLYYITDIPFCAELPITYTDLNSKKRNILFSSLQIAAGIAGAAFTGGASLGLVATGTGSMISPATKTTSIHHGKGGRVTSVTQTEKPAEYAKTKKVRPDKLINFVSNSTIDLMASFVPKNFGGKGNSLGTAWFLDNVQAPTLYYGTIDYYYPDGYNHLVGRPSRYVGKLSGLYGYTEIAGVHIENIKIATSDERTAIEEELKTGVILPNPPSS